MKNTEGKIISVKGQIVEVEFTDPQPKIHDVLVCDNVRMEVYSSGSSRSFNCLALGSTRDLFRGAVVKNTNEPILFPVGNDLRGRAVGVFGEPLDSLGEVKATNFLPIHKE